ncbi:hypothetical protein PPERSA_11809 [Pseudocohnilembus persalinus]|uniref:Cytidyltransferase-like domain-containing protein n=1 Tax=Pseudocohnilembus persalinus TaxID=266149 RepID=A0A0V0QRD5_PSEPJ|nr:hypothetical protein PPERSA_11809 [Pseudocohnilembus persalinus]|eukprot:KRX04753.1 hypothetical protein PPERSA_11809 [Pseudocohnilembus persalinus]
MEEKQSSQLINLPEHIDKQVFQLLLDRDSQSQMSKQKNVKINNKKVEDREFFTPISQKTLEDIKNNFSKYEKLCILYTQGAYNPIHKGHINMIKTAKEYLEENFNYKVIHAYVSPAPQTHINKKFAINENENQLILDIKERVKFAEITIKNMQLSDLITVDTWEANQGKVSHLDVWSSMQEFVEKQLEINQIQAKNVEVFWITGMDKIGNSKHSVDKARKQLNYKGKQYFLPVLIKQRPEMYMNSAQKMLQREVKEMKKQQQKDEKIFLLNDKGNYSSTEFRNLLIQYKIDKVETQE